jgi:acetyltransferase
MANGSMTHVSFRPIRADDVTRLQEFHRRLSPDVVRLRFHGYLRELPDTMAERFCQVDGRDRAAFVAVTGDPEQIVGVGRYDWQGDGVAEAAFVVQDSYQRLGIGTALLHRVIEAARARGVHTFLARVLHENTAIRHLMAKTGYPLSFEHHREDDCLRLSLPEGIT